MFPAISNLLTTVLVSAGAVGGVFAVSRLRYRRKQRQEEIAERIESERAAGRHLCLSTIEALAYAMEASDPYNSGHLDCVQRCVASIAKALGLPPGEMQGLRAAALLHNIGRLGVPDSILHKAASLTPEEQEKLRVHPVLGARILASIPFPWPIVPMVRHHAEHWDGSGYPDNLRGDAIPLGARILAIANAYSALQRPRPFRASYAAPDALAEIEARSGTQFDPAIVAAFRTVASQIRADAEADQALLPPDTPSPEAGSLTTAQDARSALNDIAAAQRESLALARVTEAISESLHLEAVSHTLLTCAQEIVPCAACVLFLPEEEGELLRAHAALGRNERYFLGSVARVGAYLTGRAFSRGEIKCASYLPDDLTLRQVSGPWTTMRSTLIVPLTANGEAVGTLNLYAEEAEAFGPEAQRLMRLVASQAGRAIDNARRFTAVQETAYTDALTGLRNARYLREFLERELNRAQRDGASLAVLNIDLNNFKPINDQFGHARGDQILREVAEILNGHIRNYDLAARYAGDEFVVVLAGTNRLAAEIVATKLKMAVERHGQRLTAREPDFPPVSLSVGIALYPEDAPDQEGLFCKSDAAMYSDKKAQRAARQGGDDRQAA